MAPYLELDRNLAENWRASASIGGNPGTNDGTFFTGAAAADADQDGLSAFLEYALGTSDNSAASGPGAWSVVRSGTDLLFTFPHQLTAEDATLAIETSTDLAAWAPAPRRLESSVQVGSTVTETHRITPPAGTPSRFYLRLHATGR